MTIKAAKEIVSYTGKQEKENIGGVFSSARTWRKSLSKSTDHELF
jgi:hypothetical protein